MVDAYGNPIEIGDNVLIILPSKLMAAVVTDKKIGGLVQVINRQTGETPDELELTFTLRMQLVDARSGNKHPTVFRQVNPHKETIVKNENAN